ncbi:MAG: SAM-dependent methyltransferase, partial [Firmicutes bacterium]|nr:SAM-dependent methyltransferase [Bacillota bacterium]
NPPYVAKGSGIVNDKSSKFIARQETTADIEDFVSAAASLLNYKGHLFMVHRPNRLVDIFYYCRKYNLEPKDIRFVAPSEGRIPNIVLIHSILGGGHELNYLDTLNVYDKEGNYTAEIVKIYEKTG